jgi:hypothetical protein
MTDLLREAGFVDVREMDATRAFVRTTRNFLETSREFHPRLAREWGDEALANSQRHWRKTLAVTEEGALCRGIFVGRRPQRQGKLVLT